MILNVTKYLNCKVYLYCKLLCHSNNCTNDIRMNDHFSNGTLASCITAYTD